MAWTTPMTFIDGAPLTAAQLNTHLRDNFLETVPAKSTNNGGAGGGYFAVAGPYSLAERGIAYSEVNTGSSQSTTSTTYTDLSTVGPTVSVLTGKVAIVFYNVEFWNSARKGECAMGIEISGKTIKEAKDDTGIVMATDGGAAIQAAGCKVFDDLEPGMNIFTMKYRAGSETANFNRRRLLVMPL